VKCDHRLVHRPEFASLRRRQDGRLVAGVCAGLARSWRLDVSVVRLGFLALCLAGGIGVLVYAALWVLMPVSDDTSPAAPSSPIDDGAALVAAVGALLLLRAAGVWFADAVTAVGLVVAVGVVLVSGRADRPVGGGSLTSSAPRIAVGVVLLIAGLVAFAAWTRDISVLGPSLLAAVVATAGVALLAGPRLGRLVTELSIERRARIRSEEKAEIAAHLHDGVLQTLTLIQQRAGDNRHVVALARRQERELREWLYGAPTNADTMLGAAVAREIGAVEDDQQVAIELVVVGDTVLDEPARALVAAVREAATNAARHADVDRVDVYVEVEPERLTGYVRDRGRGFDPSAVPADRRGLADSVLGRVQRAGGAAAVRSEPGVGTEVSLEVPRGRA
jgi:signal transduction histidine kinase